MRGAHSAFAVPRGINLGEVQRRLLEVRGVTAVHDLHVWTVNNGMVAMSGHVVVPELTDHPLALVGIRGAMGRLGIAHVTVQLEVEDECGGLPEGQAENLFRPFTQRSADRTGVGLGLAIARASVEANGGTIQARNLPGTGCVFTVELPVRRGTPDGSAASAPSAAH